MIKPNIWKEDVQPIMVMFAGMAIVMLLAGGVMFGYKYFTGGNFLGRPKVLVR